MSLTGEIPQRVLVEADGGSRGNPGPAAYGALVVSADTGAVLGETAASIGVATNNVAEYRGLIAGLELVRELAADATIEVRMDSRLVVEQMAGRWKIKHPDMRALALRAQRLVPSGARWTWIPRGQNSRADTLVNEVLDGLRADGVTYPDRDPESRRDGDPESHRAGPGEAGEAGEAGDPAAPEPPPHDQLVGWRTADHGTPTTVLLVRHGVTANTERRLFCGTGGSDPGLTEGGRLQAARAGAWLTRRGGVEGIVSSPMRRTRETAGVVAEALGLEVGVDGDLAEASFGDWDGLDLAGVRERWPDELHRWLGDAAYAPPGGESLMSVTVRVRHALDRALVTYAGRTVVVVSHVTPIKAVVRRALAAPLDVMHRMQIAPGSISIAQWWPDGVACLRTLSAVPD